jgi:hypothetical protein
VRNLEQNLFCRWPGLKMMRLSIAAGAVGIGPLLLYILIGPKDGNPIGLGLLAMMTVPFAGIGFLAGFAKFCLERSRGPQ